MSQVRVRKGEDVSKAIKRFKRKIESEGILREVKRRKHYLKPSEKKRVKRIEAAKRRRKTERRSNKRD